MFGFKKRSYPLPKVPPTIRSVFRRLAQPLPDQALAGLAAKIEAAKESTNRLAEDGLGIDLELAQKLADTAEYLLSRYNDFPIGKQALIAGAIRYYTEEHDALPVEIFATGLDDDVRIMNHVLEQLGITDRFIVTRRQ